MPSRSRRTSISRERVRQIERRMTDRLRQQLRQELGEGVEVALGAGA
jgi:DNA-directed RNA polymerase sigma subunit (sigma70/sigma32)